MIFQTIELQLPTGYSEVVCVGATQAEFEADRAKHLADSLRYARETGAVHGIEVPDVELTEVAVAAAWEPVRVAQRRVNS